MWRRLQGRYRKLLSQKSAQRRCVIEDHEPMVSFTFDDFPRNALSVGGRLLGEVDARGTYYASFGMTGSLNSPVGPLFTIADIEALLKDGHELGCHTFDHYHSWDTDPREYERSIVANAQALKKTFPQYKFQSFSFPQSAPKPSIKRRVGKHFLCCRSGGQTFNSKTLDLNQLRSFFIDIRNRDDLTSIREVIHENKIARGWLIFSTHDISLKPTDYGCTPEFFREVIALVSETDAEILPVSSACAQVCRTSLSRPINIAQAPDASLCKNTQ